MDFKYVMANLYFRYGTMASSKSANLLMSAFNYERQGKKVLLLKPEADTRSEVNMIESRIGLKHEAITISIDCNIVDVVKEHLDVHCIFVDEVQFFSRNHIKQMAKVVDIYNIPVLCYGLKNSYSDGELFESIKELLYQANRIEEVKSVCECPGCTKAATHHLRVVDGVPVRTGSGVKVGDNIQSNDYYISCCRNHYYTFQP